MGKTKQNKKYYPARILYPVKIFFKNESEINQTENLSLEDLYYGETLKELFFRLKGNGCKWRPGAVVTLEGHWKGHTC